MQAIILAGGFGTRLRPLTEQLPKPMVSVANEPLLAHTLALLKDQGITDVGITLGYLPQYIKDFFSDGSDRGMNIIYFEEDLPLGTAGSVKQAEKYLDETFLVISGDALTNIPVQKVFDYHRKKDAEVTVVAKREVCPLEYGVADIAPDGKIMGFSEKPLWENVTSDTVNTGIYILEKSVLDKIPEKTEYDFGKDLFPVLLSERAKVYGYITENYWSDLGTPETYLQANFDFLNGKFKNYNAVTGKNLQICEETEIVPPVMIGKNVTVTGKSVIGPFAVIGDGTLIENGKVKNSVIADEVKIKNTELNFVTVASGADCDGCFFAGHNVVGAGVKAEKNAHILYGVRVPCNVLVERNTTVDGRYGFSYPKKESYFTDGKITGTWGHDITPECLEGLASSIKGDRVCVSYGDGPLTANCASLLSSFFALSGKNVYLFKSGESSFRYFAYCNGIKGVYISGEYPNIELQVADENGLNISSNEEKKINFSLKVSGESKKIIRLENREKHYEYFLNSSFPFMRSNISVYSNEKLKLHNIVQKQEIPKRGVHIFAPNGRITDMYRDGVRISLNEFYGIKCDLAELLGAKEIFLPVYAPKECTDYAREKGLEVLKIFSHKGNTMQQVEKFISPACLLEFDPAFFALCYCFYRDRINAKARGGYIAEFTFECDRNKTSSVINLLNKKNNGFVTVVPKNDGHSFSVYKKFATEEYAPDMIESFVQSAFDEI